jgi:two-component system, LytTR family, response regulator
MPERAASTRANAVDEPTPITVLIVDDERPARRKLRRMLDGVPGIAKVFEAPTARFALDVIREAMPDVVFLDVRMPGMDGFQLIDALGPRPAVEIVFVTAYDEHAVRAFDVRAIDYLLKPFDETRFRAAVERARDAVSARRRAAAGTATAGAASARDDADLLRAIRLALAAGSSATADRSDTAAANRLLVDAGSGRQHLLPLERVRRIEADRNDAVIHADERTFRLRSTLVELEDRLPSDRFVRISRSEIVNVDFVVEVEPLDHGDARIHMRGGDVRRMSRRYRDRLRRF